MTKSVRLLFFFLVLTTSFPAFSQTNFDEQQGLKPYDSLHGGDLDTVSLTNGSVMLHIPLVSFPQRGSLDLSFFIIANSKQWGVVTQCNQQTCFFNWAPMPRGGVLPKSAGAGSVVGAQVLNSVDYWLQGSSDTSTGSLVLSHALVNPDGSIHQLGTNAVYPARSLDATGLVQADDRTIILPSGVRFDYANMTTVNRGSEPTSVTDPNGNQITINASGWTDSLGRFVPRAAVTTDLSTCPTGTASALNWDVPSVAPANGGTTGTRRFKKCYSNFTIATSFGHDATEYGPTNNSLLSAVVLPDLTMWTFSYDSYGDISRVGFPTGGYISYVYGGGTSCSSQTGSRWVTSRTVNANDGTGDHTWTYEYSATTFNGQPALRVTVTTPAPDSNVAVHTMITPVAGTCGYYEAQAQYYQGPATGTPIKTVTTQYTGNPDYWDLTIANNVVATQTTVTASDGHSSKTIVTYDSGNSFGEVYLNSSITIPVIFGSVLQKDEYDFSNALVRSTFNHYKWQDDANYKNSNFLGLQVSSILKDSAGCEMAKTSSGYDETYNSIALQPSGITTQHGTAPWPVRGNHTSTSKWLISGCAEQSAVTAHTIPFDTGLPYQSYDPLGHMTQFTYSSAFAGAYLTQTNMPDTQMPDAGAPVVHHVISGDYDFNTGLLTRFTDENSQNFTYTYDDMLRLKQGNHPDGGITKFLYPDVNTVERQRLITGTTYDDFKVKFDGLGRPYQTQQLTPDCPSYIKVDTTYDVVGRAKTVSNPYCLTSEPTYGITQSDYDALSRVTKTTKQDGSFTTVKFEDTPADPSLISLVCTTATDESGKKRQTCSDAFGRLAQVFEPNPSSAATHATGWVGISGSEQSGTSNVTITVPNAGFETPVVGSGAFQYGPTGGSWTFVGAGISGNASGFTSGNPVAPDGVQVAFLQGGSANSISQSLSGFQSGATYTVTFKAAQRGNFNQGGQDFDVYLDSTLLATFRPAGTGYSTLSTPGFTTTAGNHTLKFQGRNSSGGDNTALIDAVQVTGIAGIADTGTVTITVNGTPYTYNYGATDNAGTITAGLTSTINAGSLATATSSANSDVTVANSGLETPVVGSGAFQYGPTGGTWTFAGNSGISGNGSGFTAGNPVAPEGVQVAFLQMGSASVISQQLSGFQTGVSYRVTFFAAQRANISNGGEDFDVYLDDDFLGTFRPAGTGYSSMSTATFTTTAGNHTLKFFGRNSSGGDNTALIDAVHVVASGGNTIILTSTATGSAANYTLTTSNTHSANFTQSSFTAAASGTTLTGGTDPGGLNANSLVTTYQYNVRNDMLCVHQKATDTSADVPCTGSTPPSVPAAWRQRFFTYDSFSRLLTAMNPELNSTGSTVITYGYDNDSRVTSKVEPAPNAPWGSSATVTVTYTYDNLDRLLDTTFSDGTTLKASHRYDYSSFQSQTFANPIGREVAAFTVNSGGSNVASSYTSYDVMGRAASTVQCNPGVTGCKTFIANYDKLGDLTSVVYPNNNFTVTYGYDSAARLISATDSNGVIYAQNPTFLAAGMMKEFTSPNFNSNKYHVEYNNRLQPIEIWAGAGQGGSALFDKQYSYGTTGANNGNIFTITNVKDSTRTQTFTYDPLNRLLTAGDQTHWSNNYVYDAWGNLYQKSPGTLPGENLVKVPDTNNHLSGLTYDAGGNVINDGLGGTFTFDAENRINTAGSVTYTYDADGRRIQKSTGINYWYDPGSEVLAETDSAGNWTNYIYFAGQRLARNVNGDIKYYVTDHLHSTGMFVDKAGTTAAILDDNDFYPWGGVVPGVGKTTSNNTVKFTGQYRDTDTAANLDYFGARYYSNTVGRFTSPDWAAKPVTVPYAKFGDPQSLNLYSYVENGPINRIDPDGHSLMGNDGVLAAPGYHGIGNGGFESPDDRYDVTINYTNTYADGQLVSSVATSVTVQAVGSSTRTTITQPQQQQAQNSPTVSVTVDLYTNKAIDKGYAGAQIQLTATVKGDNSVAYNWDQTVTTDNPTGKKQKANVPFKDAAPDTGMYWSAANQQKAMKDAAKNGATITFADTPQRFVGVSFKWHAKLSLVGIHKDGKKVTLWTATWGVKVTSKGSTIEPLKVLKP